MNRPKKKNSSQKSVDWLKYINEHEAELVVPVCPKFQANVPEWAEPCKEADEHNSGSSQLLGKRIWPTNDNVPGADKTVKIGDGRSDACKCSKPGSYQCTRRHISEEKIRLRNELGEAAYEEWKFDEMGENVSRSWTSQQQKKFESFVRKNPGLQGERFLKSALELFRGTKTRQDLVSYYLNVYTPKRLGMLTRSGHKIVDSDDEVGGVAHNVKIPSKRSQPQVSGAERCMRPRYLTGRR